MKSYGVTASQIRDLARTREVTRDIDFRSPVAGLVMARNVSKDQYVNRGAELFRIADISHIWVLASAFENDELAFRAGRSARIFYNGHEFKALVSQAREFDPVSRTFRIRLELNNP